MGSPRSSPKVNRRIYGTLSLALLCIVFVSHGLLVWGHDPWFDEQTEGVDDDDDVDFMDMVNYDPVSKKMINKGNRENNFQVRSQFYLDSILSLGINLWFKFIEYSTVSYPTLCTTVFFICVMSFFKNRIENMQW